jgi:hypothetical protein
MALRKINDQIFIQCLKTTNYGFKISGMFQFTAALFKPDF